MDELNTKYGKLITPGIKIHRKYFEQLVKLLGIQCIFKAPKKTGKHFSTHGDLETDYEVGKIVGCIFEDHPNQKTLKKQGWVAELQDGSSMIHVPYDLEGLEVGALFIVPSGLDNAKGRVFRVISMQNIMIYPASISCEIAPEYESTNKTSSNIINDFTKTTGNVLLDNEEDD